MFPQALVQNKILSKSKDNFALDWSTAAPILNANYFYIDQLVDESQKYRKLLRPWTEVDGPSLKLHEYYAATTKNPDYGINIGDWVGRVRNLHPESMLKDCLVLTSSVRYYIYDDVTQSFILNSTAGVPCTVRPSMWGMTTRKAIALNDTQIQQVDNHFQYTCHSTDIRFRGEYGNIDLAYTTDAVMGRILLDNQLIAHVPVTIQRKWNERLSDYEFALTFPNFNFPPNAVVEFW